MTTYPDHILRMGSQHLAELKRKAAEFERQLWDAHESLEYEMTQSSFAPERVTDARQEAFGWSPRRRRSGRRGWCPAGRAAARARTRPARARGQRARRAAVLSRGPHRRSGQPRQARRQAPPSVPWRRAGRHCGRSRCRPGHRAGAGHVTAPSPAGPPAWPRSQRQIAVACQNPDVASEPSQVNFACAKGTRQILWVFSLLTSGNNPDYASIKTGRQGLEPITPAQGGEVAWSLNLHHPYNPANPIDSLAVAARAINNIIGGATLTAANGKPVVQSGL